MATGLDYLESSFSAIVYQYIRMYNDPFAYKIKRQNTTRYDEVFGMKNNPYGLILDQRFEEAKGTLKPVDKEDGNGFDLKFTYLVNFTSKEYGKGQIDFGIYLEFLKNYDENKNKNMWQINFKHENEPKLVNFGCK